MGAPFWKKLTNVLVSGKLRLGPNAVIDANGTELTVEELAMANSVNRMSVASGVAITSTTADEVAVVSAGGNIVIEHIMGVCQTLHEAEAAAVFDNIITGASGNLYSADQETALQDSAFEVGDYVVFTPDGPVVVEAATGQTEDSRSLEWLVAAGDTIDIEGGSAGAEGAVSIVITYRSLGGELEVESP